MNMTDIILAVTLAKKGGAVFPGDPYPGVDLTQKFAAEIAEAGNPWAWIHGRTQVENFEGIHVGDYIPLVANSNNFKASIMGINTYKGYGDTAVGNHIDFMSDKLWHVAARQNPVLWNNGLIPVETITADGTQAEWTLTKQMDEIASVKQGGVDLTGWSYENTTYKLKFEEAPAAGSITVTGTGSEHPYLASEMYLFLNSLTGHVANSTDTPPSTAVKRFDYSESGIYHYLPDDLKAVIVEKRLYLEKRYNASSKLSSSNSGAFANLGKLWLPTEIEVFGAPVWGGTGFSECGSLQYPLFRFAGNRVKEKAGASKARWWLLTTDTANSGFCCVEADGYMSHNYASYTMGVPICFRIA